MATYIEKKELLIDNIDPNLKTISICLYDVVYKDEVKFAETKGPRRAFLPGELDKVQEWIAECEDKQLALDICAAMWA